MKIIISISDLIHLGGEHMFRIWTYRVAPFTSQIQLVSWPLSVCIYQHFSERETKKKKIYGGDTW